MHITHMENTLLDSIADYCGEIADESGATSDSALVVRGSLLYMQDEINDFETPPETDLSGRKICTSRS